MGELERRPNAWALTPLVVFLLTYLVISIVADNGSLRHLLDRSDSDLQGRQIKQPYRAVLPGGGQ